MLVMRLPKWSMVMTTPLTAPGRPLGSSTQAGTTLLDALAEVRRHAAPGGQLRSDGREDVPAVEGGARAVNAEHARARRREPHDRWRRDAVRRSGASSPLSGARNTVAAGRTAMMSREVPTPGSTTAMCTVPGGKVLEGARQPEARFRRPVHEDLVRQIDDARVGEAAEDDALHHADERPLVPEVGGDGDDAGRLHRVTASAMVDPAAEPYTRLSRMSAPTPVESYRLARDGNSKRFCR